MNQAACNIFGIQDRKLVIAERANIFENPLTKPLFKRDNPQPYSGIVKVDFDKNAEIGLFLSNSITGIHYLEIHITPIFDEKQVFDGVIVNYNDVTEMEMLARNLRESLQRTELAIKSANMILWEMNLDTMTFTCHNDTINHFEGGNIPLKEMENVMDEEGKKAIHEHIRIIREKGEKHICMHIRLHKLSNDSWRNCTIYVSVFDNNNNDRLSPNDNQQQFTRYVGFCIDNTDVINLSKEVEDYSTRMKFALSSVGASEWKYDPYTQLVTSPDVTGAEIKTTDWHEMVKIMDGKYKDETVAFFEKMTRCEADSISLQAKIYYPNQHGKYVHLSVDGRAYRDAAGKILFYTGLSNDITGLIDTQMRLREEMEKAQRADRLKSSFLANMSHEIRTPLNAIVGFSQLLSTMENKEERTLFSKIIKENSDLLIKLVNNTLELSKIESGTMDVALSEFDLDDFMKNFCESMRYRTDKTEITAEYAASSKRCKIKTDRMILSTIISEFFDNAIKFTSYGIIHLGYTVNDGIVDIFVKDEGIGIPKDKLNAIFEKFEKVDKFTQGVGLGLSICRESARLIGAQIHVESDEGKGSCFHVCLPRTCIVTTESDC